MSKKIKWYYSATEVARTLGVSRSTIQKKLKVLAILPTAQLASTKRHPTALFDAADINKLYSDILRAKRIAEEEAQRKTNGGE